MQTDLDIKDIVRNGDTIVNDTYDCHDGRYNVRVISYYGVLYYYTTKNGKCQCCDKIGLEGMR